MKSKITPIFSAAMAMIVISSLMIILDVQSTQEMYAGFINFIFALAILVLLAGQRIFYKKKPTQAEWVAVLAIFNMSCFSLNNEVNLFSQQATWVYALLGILYGYLIIQSFWESPPTWLKVPGQFILGLGLFISGYFTFYMLPLFPIGIMAILFLGLGVHVFIPLALFITLIYIAYGQTEKPLEKAGLISGIILPIAIIIFFSTQWLSIHHQVNRMVVKPKTNFQILDWVNVAQRIPTNWVTKLYITGDFKFDTINEFFNGGGWGLPTWDSGRIHDPILNIAYTIAGPLPLSENDRLNILKTTLNDRHSTQRKLWTGRDLSIHRENTTIELYPTYRLAYTEKTFWIKNNSWDQQSTQEALLTFHLPEGAVATSLSLWVNGEERKSRLTTKEKADQAYVAIVGVERRDPALLHWQEGNRLTLTVFPCTNEEMRQVKVGITIPLKLEEESLIYEQVTMEGPIRNGQSTIELTVLGDNNISNIPGWFKQKDSKTYTYDGWSKPTWEIAMAADIIDDTPFSFNGHCYQLQPIAPQTQMGDFQHIYLDINKSWSKASINQLLTQFPSKVFYVYANGQMVTVHKDHQKEQIDELLTQHFSIFPVHLIEPERSLFITQNGHGTPYFKDLDLLGSFMINSLTPTHMAIKTFCIGHELPGYLRHFDYSQHLDIAYGSLNTAIQWIQQDVFPTYPTPEKAVTIKTNGTQIVKMPNCEGQGDMDHLLRLYNYNYILAHFHAIQQDSSKNNQPLIELANESFAVSPISSLVVLETQKDYERFDIDVNEKSLQNAATKKVGAAPEPHEWILIVVCSLFLLWMYRTKP